jgi:putative redox protein
MRTVQRKDDGMKQENGSSREGQVTVRGPASSFVQSIEMRSHRLVADEPVAVGGTDTGPTPYDLILAALGA